MTKGNKLTRPWGGPGTRTSIGVGSIPTNFSWNSNPENQEWEIVKGKGDARGHGRSGRVFESDLRPRQMQKVLSDA
jgi:hypothetical protein